MTQTERVEKYMRDFGSITQLEAFRDLGIMRLSARIWDLRNAGRIIKAENTTSKNRYGEAVTFKKYSLEDCKNDTL